jgi:hypothetical protein
MPYKHTSISSFEELWGKRYLKFRNGLDVSYGNAMLETIYVIMQKLEYLGDFKLSLAFMFFKIPRIL